jgi:hypothetical protein
MAFGGDRLRAGVVVIRWRTVSEKPEEPLFCYGERRFLPLFGSRGRCARLRVIDAQLLKLLVRVREVFDSGLQRQCPCFSAPLISVEQRDHALGSADEVHRLGQQEVVLVVHVVRPSLFGAERSPVLLDPLGCALNADEAETIRR